MTLMVNSNDGCLQRGVGDVYGDDGTDCKNEVGGDDGDDDDDYHVVVDSDDGCPQQGSGKKGDFDNGPLCSIYGPSSAWTESCEVFILYFSLDVLMVHQPKHALVTQHYLWFHNYTFML